MSDLQENEPLANEQPYPSHCATRKPQLRNHWSRPDSAPLHFGIEISDAYIGIVLVSMPTATPPMKRPMMSMTMLTEPVCKAAPRRETTDPAKMVFLRPSQSAKICTMNFALDPGTNNRGIGVVD